MILRIFIGSETLDIQSDISFSVVKTNAIFDFDNFVYTRSTSFQLRRTVRNERILQHSGDIHATGVRMRAKTRCRVEINGVQSVGYLYLTSSTREAYECQLLLGEFVDSPFEKTIKQVLNAADYGDVVYYGNNSLTETANGTHKDDYIAPIRYYSGKVEDGVRSDNAKPSVYAKRLLDAVIPNTLQDVECRLVRTPDNESDLQGKDIKLFFGNDGSVYFGGADADSGSDYLDIVRPYGETKYLTNVDVSGTGAVVETTHILEYFSAKVPLYLRAATAGAYIYTGLRYIQSYATGTTQAGIRHIITAQVSEPEWLAGSVGLHTDSTYKPYFYASGAAEDIYIPAGTVFRATTLASNYPMQAETSETLGQLSVLGGRYGGAAFYVAPANDRAITTQWDCIPDIKVGDLVRSYARLAGALVYYDGSKVYTVKALASPTPISDVVEVGKVERKFGGFAQKTIIQYDDSDMGSVEYDVANDYLNEESVKKLPVSTGGVYSPSDALYIEEMGKGIYVGKVGEKIYMTRKAMPKNKILAALCTYSTLQRLRVRMTYAQFSQLRFDARYIYDCCEWVWSEATWQDGFCEFVLQKYR